MARGSLGAVSMEWDGGIMGGEGRLQERVDSQDRWGLGPATLTARVGAEREGPSRAQHPRPLAVCTHRANPGLAYPRTVFTFWERAIVNARSRGSRPTGNGLLPASITHTQAILGEAPLALLLL